MTKGRTISRWKLVGVDSEGNLFEGIMTFIINSLKQSIPFVTKATPEVKSEGLWLSEQIDKCIQTLHKIGFNISGSYFRQSLHKCVCI